MAIQFVPPPHTHKGLFLGPEVEGVEKVFAREGIRKIVLSLRHLNPRGSHELC